MKCKICGAENLDDAKYCEKCGSSLEDVVIVHSETNVPFKGKNKEGYATASMVLGIISVVFGTVLCCFNLYGAISLITGVLSIIFAILGWNSTQKGRAVAGLVCGIIGVIFGFMMLSFEFLADSEGFEEYIKQNYPDLWEQFYRNN